MSHNNRQQLEIEYRRQCVKDIWIKLGVFDVTQDQITEALAKDFGIEVDRSTVSRDLGVIKKRIKEQTADELRAEFFAGYMRLITQAREGWRRSLEDAVTETSEVIETPSESENDSEDEKGKKGNSQRLKVSTRTMGQSGNPSFLEQEQRAYKAMREMFGVDIRNDPGSSEDNPLYHKMVVLPPKNE